MTTRFVSFIFTTFLGLCVAMSALAGDRGDGSHGGSSVFIKGKWDLADMFVGSHQVGDPLLLSDEMTTVLGAMQYLAQTYGIDSHEEFWENQVLGYRVEYRSVEKGKLPCKDDPIEISEPGLTQVAYGCTKNSVTYLIEGELAKLPFESRALAIVHERLHAFNPKAKHTDIARVIRGLAIAVRLQQEQNAGSRRNLYPQEIRALEDIFPAGKALGFQPFPFFIGYPNPRIEVLGNGGGILASSEPGSMIHFWKSFVGVGSRIFADGKSNVSNIQFSEIIESEVAYADVIGSKVIRSEVFGGHTPQNIRKVGIYKSEITSSKVDYGSQILGANLENSHVLASKLIQDSVLKDAHVEWSEFDRAFSLESGWVSYCQIIKGTPLAGCKVMVPAAP